MNIEMRLIVKKIILSCLYLFCWLTMTWGAEINYDLFSQLLQKNVKNGQVDYKSFLKDQKKLNVFLNQLANASPDKMKTNEKMALYINAYNAYTIQLILNHYPIKSIKDISSSKRWIYKGWLVGGKKVSLDQIEHEILRPMGDPRIHFAINCASISCPDLISEAFTPATLDEQLNKAMHSFLANKKKGLVFRKSEGFLGFGAGNKVVISKIFDWFEEDFEKKSGSVIKFLQTHAVGELKKKLMKYSEADIQYLDYNWNLNGK